MASSLTFPFTAEAPFYKTFQILETNPKNTFKLLYVSSAWTFKLLLPWVTALEAFSIMAKEVSDCWCVFDFFKDLSGEFNKKANESYLFLPKIVKNVVDLTKTISARKIFSFTVYHLQQLSIVGGTANLFSAYHVWHLSNPENSWNFYGFRALSISLIGLGLVSGYNALHVLVRISQTAEKPLRYIGIVGFYAIPHYAVLMLALTTLNAVAGFMIDYSKGMK